MKLQLTLCLGVLAAAIAPAQPFIVHDGRAQAQIVIAEEPARTVKLAAAELQTTIEKISGARLPVTNAPSARVPVKIYVGQSAETERLGISVEGLRHGAFKMVSGEDFLALIGRDSDFVLHPIPRRSKADGARAQADWDKATGGAHWGIPYNQAYKQYSPQLDVWEKDEAGSLNAVYRFLYDQGVRWYAPGQFGEVVPKTATIELPAIDRTVVPDFQIRYADQYGKKFGAGEVDEALWQLRMGFNQAPDVIGIGNWAHGIEPAIRHPEMRKAHPEYYAVRGNRRMNGELRECVPCLSSEGLFQENVRLVRALFDIFNAPMVSVQPTDGFIACQCEACQRQIAPDRGWLGQYSDYVWGYVDRVAREVYETHPDRKINAMAYGSYYLPPEKIKTLSPNIVVCMTQYRQDLAAGLPLDTVRDLRAAYLRMLPAGSRQLMVYDYYRLSRPKNPNSCLPIFTPKAIAQDLRALKPFSLGDVIEVYREPGLATFGVSHLNLYVTARYWWDADQDLDALLNEYYTLFYGPARDTMKAFVEYGEANWREMSGSIAKIDRAFELAAAARAAAPTDSIYGKRVAWVLDTIEPMKKLRETLTQDPPKAPQAHISERRIKDLTLDGSFADPFWNGVAVHDLKEFRSGRAPVNKGSFKAAWADDTLCFAITCHDSDVGNLNIATTSNEDPSIWTGDFVEINLGTPVHSYYQLSIGPTGALIDLDREEGLEYQWSSNARVAVGRTADAWTLEVSIPVASEMQGAIDNRHGVSGPKPSAARPWRFNVCRQRVRGNSKEHCAFSPLLGPGGFHVLSKYGELVVE